MHELVPIFATRTIIDGPRTFLTSAGTTLTDRIDFDVARQALTCACVIDKIHFIEKSGADAARAQGIETTRTEGRVARPAVRVRIRDQVLAGGAVGSTHYRKVQINLAGHQRDDRSRYGDLRFVLVWEARLEIQTIFRIKFECRNAYHR